MPNPPIQIPRERHAQLKQIAEGLGGASMSAVIGELIRAFADQGRVEHALPGVRINSFRDGVAVAFEDGRPVPLTRAQALALAGEIEVLVVKGLRLEAQGDRPWTLSRRGGAYVVRLVQGNEKVWPGDVALDFGRLLRRTVPPVEAVAA